MIKYSKKKNLQNTFTALVAFTSATNEQIKGAEQIGMKLYSWNDFLKMVSKEIVRCSQFTQMKYLDKSIQTANSVVMFVMTIYVLIEHQYWNCISGKG